MPSTLEKLRAEHGEAIQTLAAQHGISKVRVFGSVAREEDGPESDIDFLISLEEGRGLMEWSGFWIDLQELLGRDVDVVEENSIHWFLKKPILAEATSL